MAEGFEKILRSEPVHPFERHPLHDFAASPRAPLPENFGLVESVQRLSHGVIVGVADRAKRSLDSELRTPLRVANAENLRSAIRVIDQLAFSLPGPERLLKRIEAQVGALSFTCLKPTGQSPLPDLRRKSASVAHDRILSQDSVSGKSGAVHLVFLDQILDHPDDIFDRYARVDPMLVEEIDCIDPEPFQGGFGDFPDMLLPAVLARPFAFGAEVAPEPRGDIHLRTEGGEG
jgi:hypothetical protein